MQLSAELKHDAQPVPQGKQLPLLEKKPTTQAVHVVALLQTSHLVRVLQSVQELVADKKKVLSQDVQVEPSEHMRQLSGQATQAVFALLTTNRSLHWRQRLFDEQYLQLATPVEQSEQVELVKKWVGRQATQLLVEVVHALHPSAQGLQTPPIPTIEEGPQLVQVLVVV
jgi:hypothetical protein